jgi:hypothetical protein
MLFALRMHHARVGYGVWPPYQQFLHATPEACLQKGGFVIESL